MEKAHLAQQWASCSASWQGTVVGPCTLVPAADTASHHASVSGSLCWEKSEKVRSCLPGLGEVPAAKREPRGLPVSPTLVAGATSCSTVTDVPAAHSSIPSPPSLSPPGAASSLHQKPAPCSHELAQAPARTTSPHFSCTALHQPLMKSERTTYTPYFLVPSFLCCRVKNR